MRIRVCLEIGGLKEIFLRPHTQAPRIPTWRGEFREHTAPLLHPHTQPQRRKPYIWHRARLTRCHEHNQTAHKQTWRRDDPQLPALVV
jgi:hypothetical protein